MATPAFENLVELYRHSVTNFGPKPLFGVKKDGQWGWWTYTEFGSLVDDLRGGLSSLGVGPNDCMALICNNRVEWAATAYATYGIGAAIVPMYEAQQAQEWKYILGDCHAKAVVVSTAAIRDAVLSFRSELPSLNHIICLDCPAVDGSTSWDDVIERGKETPAEAIQPAAHQIAGLIYTSGTTGNPKGVRLSHGNFASNVRAIHALFPLGSDDRSLAFLPWAHSFGQTVELHGLLSLGASMAIAESRDKIVENLAEVSPTILASVPHIFNRIYDGLHKRMAQAGGIKKALFDQAVDNVALRQKLAAQGRKSLIVEAKHALLDKLVFSKVRERFGGRLRFAVSGGAALSREVANFIDGLGIQVFEGYGLTETSPIATCNCPGARKIGSVGKAIPGVRIVIDTSAAEGFGAGEGQGEVVVYGPNVMQGYHNLPEENAAIFTDDGGLRTGDMGYLDEDGFLFITGRIKEQYKLSNGKYVVPGPLEERLKLSPYIANVMIYGDNRPHNVALIVPDLDSITDWAKQHGLGDRSLETLVEEPKVRELYKEQLRERSQDFRSLERIRDFAFATTDFTAENGLLTPSLKVKRNAVMEQYGDRVLRLYGASA